METHSGKNHKVLFIWHWHEKIDAPLSVHKSTDSVQYLLFYLYKLLFPLMLYVPLYLYHPTLLLLSDSHIAWIDLLSLSVCTLNCRSTYSDALGDLELPTQNCCILYSAQKASKQELANRLTD